MDYPSNHLENLWDHLLSRDPASIRAAYVELGMEEQEAVLSHLQRMASEPGWHPEQQVSALAALKALSSSYGHSTTDSSHA